MGWPKNIVSWWDEGRSTLNLSVPFTWLLPEARAIARAYDCPVRVGGPAVDLMPNYLSDVAGVGGKPSRNPLSRHNQDATFTTRGCPNNCGFCAVPKVEGGFRELDTWEPRPIVCDNNLLAASTRHFDRVIDSLKGLQQVDFNQGLDARLFSPHHARRIAELKRPKVRFALDHPNMAGPVKDAVDLARAHSLSNLGIYVLIGFNDTPDDAVHRLEMVRSWGIRPNPMRYQPLDTLRKNSYVAPGWTEFELVRLMQYWSRLRWLEHIPFPSYRYHGRLRPRKQEAGLFS